MALIVAGVFLGAQLVIDDHDRKQLGGRELVDDQAAVVERSPTGQNYIVVIHHWPRSRGAGRSE